MAPRLMSLPIGMRRAEGCEMHRQSSVDAAAPNTIMRERFGASRLRSLRSPRTRPWPARRAPVTARLSERPPLQRARSQRSSQPGSPGWDSGCLRLLSAVGRRPWRRRTGASAFATAVPHAIQTARFRLPGEYW